MAQLLLATVPFTIEVIPYVTWVDLATKTPMNPSPGDAMASGSDAWDFASTTAVQKIYEGSNAALATSVSSSWYINNTTSDRSKELMIQGYFGPALYSNLKSKAMTVNFRGVRRWVKTGEAYGRTDALAAADVILKALLAKAKGPQTEFAYELTGLGPYITNRVKPTVEQLLIGQYIPEGVNLSTNEILVSDIDSVFVEQMMLWASKSPTNNKVDVQVVNAAIGSVTTQAYVGTGAGDPVAENEQFYVASGSVTYEVKETAKYTYNVGLYYDDVTRQLSISPKPLDDAAKAELAALAVIQKDRDSTLYSVAKQREAGFDVKADTTMPVFEPTSTLVRENFLAWWASHLAAANKVNSIALGNPGASFDNWKLSNPNGSVEQYQAWLASTTKTTATNARDNQSTWSSLWTGLKDGASAAYDYVKQWPPTTWMAGYAGYKAIAAVEETGKSKIMWYAAAALGAIVLLK